MIVPPIVSLLVWAVVAVVLSAIGVRYYADDEREIIAICFIAYMWPCFAFIAIVLSPILVGARIGVVLQRRSENP